MTLLPQKHDFTLWRGGTFRTRLTLYNDDEGTQPQDLSEYTAILAIRDQTGSPLLTLSTENGRIVLDDEGHIDLYISDEDTVVQTWRIGFYDLLLTTPSNPQDATGDTDPLLYGKFKIKGV